MGFFATDVFFSTDEEYGSLWFSAFVADNRDVVCDLPLYSTGSAIILGLTDAAYMKLTFHLHHAR